MTRPAIGIAVFHALGDVLNLTPVVAQLRADHPDAHITWFTSRACAPALEGHPCIDQVEVMEGTWEELDALIPELAASRPWTRFLAPAPYLHYKRFPGASLWELYRLAPGLAWTIPIVPLLRLRPEEVQEARTWWKKLPVGPRILVECQGNSQQSTWTLDSVGLVVDALKGLDPVYVVSAKTEPPEVAKFRALGARVVYCGLPWRLNAELYNLADAFLGVSSGISALSGSDHCRDDVRSIEFVAGEHWSTAGLGRHRHRRYAFSDRRYQEALWSLAQELKGQGAPTFQSRLRVLGLDGDGKQQIACPACDQNRPQPHRGEDIVRCQACGLVYLKDRQTPEALRAYYTDVYAVNEPTAAPPVRIPPDLATLESDPSYRAARREPMVTEALTALAGPAKRLLDVGCGWGALLLGARERGLETLGFEYTRPNGAFARDTLKLDVRDQPFPEADLEEGSVDVVTFSHSLEHVPDPLTYLEKAAYALREGGILSVAVPNIGSLCAAALGEQWPWLEREWHVTHFNPQTLRALAIQAGFEVLSCVTVGGDLGDDLPLRALSAGDLVFRPEAHRQELEALRLMGYGEEIRLVARRKGTFKGRIVPASPPSHILWIRTDSIGDAVLSNAMLEPLAAAHPGAQITVVCQAVCAPLYEACPHVRRVITFDRARAIQEESYRRALMGRLGALKVDLCLCPVHSRETLTDLLVLSSHALVRVAFSGDTCNMTAEEHDQFDGLYTHLLPPLPPHALELDRAEAFLDALAIPHGRLAPRVWLGSNVVASVKAMLARHGLSRGEAIAFFPGAQYAPRRYANFVRALAPVLEARGMRLIALGSGTERELCQEVLDALPGRHLNLAGTLSLQESLSVLSLCRAAVGAESGLAQACCALDIPHAIVIGGGHFGRFLPYSPLTQLAALPLDCYLCNWQCPYSRAHCVQDLSPGVLGAALEAALDGPGARPRLFMSSTPPDLQEPAPIDLSASLDPSLVEVVLVDRAPEMMQAPPPLRTTVICGVWHKDPKRFELLKAHQACLDAQTVPVERLYVFDGGDQAPEWLKGQWVSTSRGLALYEAWDLAFHLARTPFVMNLNLDDRLATDAVANLERALDEGADLAGGDWRVCFSQAETDRLTPSEPASALDFHPEWPPSKPTRLGSGTGERGTYGPATLWRLDLRKRLPSYPWRFKDGSPVKIIGDAVWWELLIQAGCKLVRVPRLLGRYHSHPEDQAEFRNPADQEQAKLARVGLAYP